MPKFNPPEVFNFEQPNQWPGWKQRFSRFRLADKLNKEDGNVQVSSLIYAMGPEAENIFKTFVFTDEDECDDFDIVMQKFDEHFIPKRNIIHERARFHARTQQNGESTETFIRSLYELSEFCDFGVSRGEQIRDRIVIGITDKDLSEKLQMQSDLTVEIATETVRHHELIKSQNRADTKLDAVSRGRRRNREMPRESRGQSRGNARRYQNVNNNGGTNVCTRCGYDHHPRARCPASGKECKKCGKLGHFKVMCRNRHVREVNSSGASDHDEYFLTEIDISKEQSEPWRTQVSIGNKMLNFKIDTGADVSVISKAVFESIKPEQKLQHSKVTLRSAGTKLNCLGQFLARVDLSGKTYKVKMFVVEECSDNLLSRDASSRMGLVRRTTPIIADIDSEVFGTCGLINCKPVKIKLKTDAQPYSISAARRIPFPLYDKVKAELDRMIQDDIIQEVTEPTEWCSPMVPVPKKSGQVRICVDLKKLNTAVERERYMLPSLEDIAPKLRGSSVFTKLDASSGFYQIPLDKESQILTTFMTPFGRFCFKRIPFGITSAPEIFQRIMSTMLKDHDGTEVIMDDILIHGKDSSEHDRCVDKVLNTLKKSGLKLNKQKCEFSKEEIVYFGHTINKEGISPNPARIAAITDLEPPNDVKELRRIIGMVNYLGKFVPDLATTMKPMTDLLRDDTVFQWSPTQDKAFAEIKTRITSTPVLGFYDPMLPTAVSADASSYGLGALLFQRDGDVVKPIAYASRTLNDAELKYAQIEKECLASVWACEKFERYLVGLDTFKIQTDHRPLVPIMNSHDLDRVPLRCQRLLLRLRRFNAVAEYVPGKQLVIADALSRSPLRVHSVDVDQIEDVETFVATSFQNKSDAKIAELRRATMTDEELKMAMQLTRAGWPDYIRDIPVSVQNYHSARNELSVANDLLIFRNRIVVPKSMREQILDQIHTGHLGVNKCTERAKMCVWWPGIANDIKSKVSKCGFCSKNQPTQQREPLQTTGLPELPWQKIAADLCYVKGQNYLVVTDYFSRYIEIAHLTNITSRQVIVKMKTMFARWGIPEELVSDNGTQFVSAEFRKFADEYNFKQTTSSPHYPQSNGAAESAVKIAKRILMQDDPHLALLSYRSTTISATGTSPSQLIMGRQVRTNLPVLRVNLVPKWPDFDSIRKRDASTKASYEKFYNRRYSTKPLPTLQQGKTVHIKLDGEKQWSNQGTVLSASNHGNRSVVVDTPRGVYRRNRRHVKPCEMERSSEPGETLDFEQTQQGLDIPSDGTLSTPVASGSVPSEPSTNSPVKTRSGRAITIPKRFRE